jgi:hypothetical protein
VGWWSLGGGIVCEVGVSHGGWVFTGERVRCALCCSCQERAAVNLLEKLRACGVIAQRLAQKLYSNPQLCSQFCLHKFLISRPQYFLRSAFLSYI